MFSGERMIFQAKNAETVNPHPFSLLSRSNTHFSSPSILSLFLTIFYVYDSVEFMKK